MKSCCRSKPLASTALKACTTTACTWRRSTCPSGLGYEAVGTVSAVGPVVEPSLVGKRFGTIPGFSMGRYPVLAQQAVVPAEVLAAVPESFSAVQGAAVWMQYCTAYGALVTFGKVSSGDFVLITAASSSVGLAAIQIVRAQQGISIATTRTAAKKDQLLALGADHVIVTEEEDLAARVKEITGGKGARIVFDPVGGDYINTLGAGHRKRWVHLPLRHALRQTHALPDEHLWPQHRHGRVYLYRAPATPPIGSS